MKENSNNIFFLHFIVTGNPVPEAKWVLRGRIVTNNTSPLYGNNDNIQYVIHEKGTQKYFM